MKRSMVVGWVPEGWSFWLVLLVCGLCTRAHAFGGLWSSDDAALAQTGLHVVFVDGPDSTITAVIQVEYEGEPERFAWLVPVPGVPTVGMSSSTVFRRLEAATAPEYWVEVAAGDTCGEQPYPAPEIDIEPGVDGEAMAAAVALNEQGSVGPYEYVNLGVDPSAGDPAQAATDWLSANGYDLTGTDGDLLNPYLRDGLNLLAFKLKQGAETRALRPVILTYERERPAIPIRAAAAAARADMPIHVWVFGPSQAVPENYKSLVLNDARLDWLTGVSFPAGTLPGGGAGPFGPTAKKPGNYDALVTAAADEAGGQGFVTELGGPASQYRDKVWASVDDEALMLVTGQSYEDGVDAVVNAQTTYGTWDGWSDAVAGATVLPDGVSIEAFLRDPGAYRGEARVDTAKFLRLLEAHVVKPVSDTVALFYRAPYLTRLFSTLSPRAMTRDPVFDYNRDLAQLDKVHVARQFVECGADESDSTWRVELPQGSVIAGSGSRWPVGDGSMPATLKVVMLTTDGSGTVVVDNSEAIRTALLEGAGALGTPGVFQPPLHGVRIGGAQTVIPHEESESEEEPGSVARGNDCSVSHAGADARSGLAFALPFVALLLVRRRRRFRAGAIALVAMLALLAGCSSEDGAVPAHGGAGNGSIPMTLQQLRDPETCKGCHPIHYREWSGSMHAYAARDPVFLAMNRRGQRETHGELGDFCVRCHAPMAVVDKTTTDGLNIEELPDFDRGVSCYFCHNVVGIEGDHNALLRIANDDTMRGPIRDPIPSAMHRAEYSDLLEDTSNESSAMCGACHDIVTPSGVHLERTYAEYLGGVFSKSASGEPPAFDSCVGCHMPGRETPVADVPGAPVRTMHEHLWPGIDVALTEFPHTEAMRSAVEDCQLRLGLSFFTLEVTPPDLFTFQMENSAGHNTPSGATHDRRMWLEFLAYDAQGNLLEQSSGDIADDAIEEHPKGHAEHDPQLLMFRDRLYDRAGKPIHMFWEAEKSAAYPEGYESHALPVATTTYVEGKHAVVKQYRAAGPDGGLPARVTARLRMRPMGLDVLQDLVDSSDLDPAVLTQMPTFTFGATIEWTPEKGVMKTILPDLEPADCITYRCLIDPSVPGCD